jgi:YidC/Oxa1 family membrane protein insertase
MPKAALEGQAAQMQKIMLYVFPIFFFIGGFNFPIGVLIYWFVSNVWTMGQQFYVIRRNPAPGTPAYDALEARKKAHGKATAEGADGESAGGGVAVAEDEKPAARQQPKKQSRSARKGGTTGTTGSAGSGGSAGAQKSASAPKANSAPKTGGAQKSTQKSTQKKNAQKGAQKNAQKKPSAKRGGSGS